MNRKRLSFAFEVFIIGLLLAGCGREATWLPTATSSSQGPSAPPGLAAAANLTATPDLESTREADWQATLAAGQTQNAAYQATSSVRQTETSKARATSLTPILTPELISTPWPTSTPVPTFPSTCRSDWSNFVNSYYGYAICIPPSAKIYKNERIEGYSPEELPADWDEKDDYFDYLNRIYPPGLFVGIEYRTGLIQIIVPDHLGGKYADYGLGLGNEDGFVWVWTEEEVVISQKTYPTTVLRKCESHSPNAKCGGFEWNFVQAGEDGYKFNFGYYRGDYEQYLSDKTVMLEVLSTLWPAPKTELYCPDPAPSHLVVGGYAYTSTNPPANNRVRSGPGINQDRTGSIAPGKAVELLEGPVCNNSMQWWKVRVLSSSLVGWTSEGDHRSEWLIPCESAERCPP